MKTIRHFDTADQDQLTVTFDDEKTTVEEIIDVLGKAKFPVQGVPEYLK